MAIKAGRRERTLSPGASALGVGAVAARPPAATRRKTTRSPEYCRVLRFKGESDRVALEVVRAS
jgi:hypothetical protein